MLVAFNWVIPEGRLLQWLQPHLADLVDLGPVDPVAPGGLAGPGDLFYCNLFYHPYQI